MRKLTLLLTLTFALPVWGQFSYPASAGTSVYLGHLADGGAESQRWTTTIVLTNPSTVYAGKVTVSFYSDSGAPLSLDFGSGAAPTLTVTIPAGGSKTVTSAGKSSEAVTGWAAMEMDDDPPLAPATPISATLLYRAQISAGQYWDVATAGTGATFFYTTYGSSGVGMAVANPSATQSINIKVAARNNDGTVPGGPWTITVPARGHKSWNLGGAPTNLANFEGTVELSSDGSVQTGFVALSLNYRAPVISPLPAGNAAYPAPGTARAYTTALRARQAAATLVAAGLEYFEPGSGPTAAQAMSSKGLIVEASPTLNAYYSAADDNVHITTALLQTLGNNDAALAFLVGHVAAHGFVTVSGTPETGPMHNNPELIADAIGAGTLLFGGFDPSGGADLFGRLHYAYLQGLPFNSAFASDFAVSGPSAISARMLAYWGIVRDSCQSIPGIGAACEKARVYWHPQNAVTIP